MDEVCERGAAPRALRASDRAPARVRHPTPHPPACPQEETLADLLEELEDPWMREAPAPSDLLGLLGKRSGGGGGGTPAPASTDAFPPPAPHAGHAGKDVGVEHKVDPPAAMV